MSITRFAVINDERKLILGLDKNNLFEPGYVYEVHSILDEIVIKKIGKYALPHTGNPSEASDVNTQVSYSQHLLTEDEYKNMCEKT